MFIQLTLSALTLGIKASSVEWMMETHQASIEGSDYVVKKLEYLFNVKWLIDLGFSDLCTLSAASSLYKQIKLFFKQHSLVCNIKITEAVMFTKVALLRRSTAKTEKLIT